MGYLPLAMKLLGIIHNNKDGEKAGVSQTGTKALRAAKSPATTHILEAGSDCDSVAWSCYSLKWQHLHLSVVLGCEANYSANHQGLGRAISF